MKRVFTFLLALACLGISTAALADVPTEMSVQGRLTNASGTPVPAGLKNFTFKIFDAASGGTEIWPAGPGELQTLTTDANGLWNAGVGSIIPLTEAVFQNPVRWLEVRVDDGVNPPETMPRIELRTNPYTYRAATSQQADSLAGNSLGDIADMFVNETGDTMSGPLLIDFDNAVSSDGNLRVNNVSGANSPLGLAPDVYGVIGEAASDVGFFNRGILGLSHGSVGWALGVQGEAFGNGDYNMGVVGFAGGGATIGNYSGYFGQGDFLVSNPYTAGTGGVVLPPSTIDNTEILDEPGVAFNSAFSFLTLSPSTTAQDFITVSLTIPAAGYVVVQGTANFRFSGTNAANYAWMQIDQTSGGGSGGRFLWSGGGAHASAANEYESGSFTRVYFLSAGAHTFRLEGNGWSSNAVGAVTVVFEAEIMATYVPTAYGSVSALVSDAAAFEDATAVRVADLQGGHDVTAHAVDLRQLELKAAREQAEAEKARREFVEASLSAARSGAQGIVSEKK